MLCDILRWALGQADARRGICLAGEWGREQHPLSAPLQALAAFAVGPALCRRG